MADTKTATEWQAVASDAQAQIDAINAKQPEVDAAQKAAEAEYARLKAAANSSNFAKNSDGTIAASASADFKAARAAATAYLNGPLQVADEAASTFGALQDLTAAKTNAVTQSTAAASGPLTTSTVTPPVATSPGQDNTAVVVAPAPLVENAAPVDVPAIRASGTNIENMGDIARQKVASVDITNDITVPQSIENAQPATVTDPETSRFASQSAQSTTPAYSAPPYVSQAADSQAANAANAAEEAATANAQETARFAARGLSASLANTQASKTKQDVSNFAKKADWRVRLSLAPGSNYLYKAEANVGDYSDPAGILAPLKATDGVIFPYTPAISVAYAAHYDSSTLTHSNYKAFQYGSSSVDSITITCDFTAQDTTEANYLLAVIHFFKSATKMFYGQDQQPKRGTPPPLCYLSGLGDFQFDAHPLAITGFNYTLPTDVDYIRAGKATSGAGVNTSPQTPKSGATPMSLIRMITSQLQPGGQAAPPRFGSVATGVQSVDDATYVPTKMSLSITAIPIVTRNDISNNFSLRDYASGKLLQGTKRQGGGIW